MTPRGDASPSYRASSATQHLHYIYIDRLTNNVSKSIHTRGRKRGPSEGRPRRTPPTRSPHPLAAPHRATKICHIPSCNLVRIPYENDANFFSLSLSVFVPFRTRRFGVGMRHIPPSPRPRTLPACAPRTPTTHDTPRHPPSLHPTPSYLVFITSDFYPHRPQVHLVGHHQRMRGGFPRRSGPLYSILGLKGEPFIREVAIHL